MPRLPGLREPFFESTRTMLHTEGAKPATSRQSRHSQSAIDSTERARTTAPLPTYIRLTQLVSDVVPVSRATIWRWVKSGNFPSPIKLAERTTAWKLTEVLAWMDARAAI